MTVRFNELPNWAKEEITEASEKGFSGQTQVVKAGGRLSITGGSAFFKGELVLMGDEVVEEKTIHFFSLPRWAKREIRKAGKHGLTQIAQGSDHLSVSGGTAYFNGAKVVR